MPFIGYKHFKFRARTLECIEQANAIINEYAGQGFSLTLRQLYYQFVARGMIDNRQSEYKRLGSIINDGRLGGLIDWNAIEDRTRNRVVRPRWESPQDIITAVAQQYHKDRWRGQKVRPEVWIEKEALVGVIEPVCDDLDIPYFACRGYVSQSEQWRAGQRYERILLGGQSPVVFHLGDHDPSGIDMTRDNQDRLSMFAHFGVRVERLALNMDQVEEFNPPPNPAKQSDSRWLSYAEEFGLNSWELDALEPTTLDHLIRDAANALIDRAIWSDVEYEERTERERIQAIADNFDLACDLLGEEE